MLTDAYGLVCELACEVEHGASASRRLYYERSPGFGCTHRGVSEVDSRKHGVIFSRVWGNVIRALHKYGRVLGAKYDVQIHEGYKCRLEHGKLHGVCTRHGRPAKFCWRSVVVASHADDRARILPALAFL
jgi:hypothetical protein